MTFTKACMDFFGRKPGQTVGEFAVELKQLTEKDRVDMVGYFKEVGIEVTK